ncbi:NUDIX hydrolase [Rhizobium puerariae]|uniref:NUDIX hydrolase n=1 Tax=Rhizobium puerariae TaxID=1585791 RepID=A0ABV6AFQ7_9HYPH
MDDPIRTMIVMDAGHSRFQFRMGALIRCRDHILIHRNIADPYWALPGGRVEFHESTQQTLAREIEEEIGCEAAVGPLRFVIENFFELSGREVHEIGFYYDAALSHPLPFHETDIVHRVRDGEAELEFRWIRPTATAFDEYDLKPFPLRALIAGMPGGIAHLVYRDQVG